MGFQVNKDVQHSDGPMGIEDKIHQKFRPEIEPVTLKIRRLYSGIDVPIKNGDFPLTRRHGVGPLIR